VARALRGAEALGVPVVQDASEVVRPAAPELPLPRADRADPAPGPDPRARRTTSAAFAEGCLERVTSPNSLSRFVLREMMEVSGALRASLLLRERGRPSLLLRRSAGLPSTLVGQVRCRIGSGVAGRAAALGRAVVGVGSAGGPRGYQGTAYVVIPLGAGRRCEGVVCLSELPSDALPESVAIEEWTRVADQATRALKAARRLRQAESLSSRDRLTGLPNRRAFERALAREMERARRAGSAAGLGVAIVDLDRFKSVNDTFGHLVGDRVLLQLARRLHQALRETDLVARWGGEEFAVLVPGVPADSEKEVRVALERARLAVRRTPFVVGRAPPLPVTISVGFARYPAHGTTAQALVAAADRALYRAKEGGRDRIEGA
jgi:diguanylate cyclase (GGDEF)-like protein